MRKVLILWVLIGFSLSSYAQSEQTINWLTWDEAIALNEKEPKKVFIDIYTDWCIPCKKMDQRTYAYPEIIDYINKNFRAIKFNAEQKDSVLYKEVAFKLNPEVGRNGLHELAVSLSDGDLSFPMTIFFNEKMKRTTILPGYMDPVDFGVALKFHGEEHYKNTKWKDYPNDGIISRQEYLAARRAKIASANNAASAVAAAQLPPEKATPVATAPSEPDAEPASLESQLRLSNNSQPEADEPKTLSKKERKEAEKKLKQEQEALQKRLAAESKKAIALAEERAKAEEKAKKEAERLAKKSKPSKKDLKAEKRRIEKLEEEALAKAKKEAEEMKKLAEAQKKADAKLAKAQAKAAKKAAPSKKDIRKAEKEALAKAEKEAEGQRKLAEARKKAEAELAKAQKKEAKRSGPSKKELRKAEKEREALEKEALAKAEKKAENERKVEEARQKLAKRLAKEEKRTAKKTKSGPEEKLFEIAKLEPQKTSETPVVNKAAEKSKPIVVNDAAKATGTVLTEKENDAELIKNLESDLGADQLNALKRVLKNELKDEIREELKAEIKKELLEELKNSLKDQ